MQFDVTPKVEDLRRRVQAFMDEHVYPNERRFIAEVEENTHAGRRWTPTTLIEELKSKARAAGLWNLFLPESTRGAGLTNLEYAPLAELMGRVP
jgi:acyl-CoA dehydrogenase